MDRSSSPPHPPPPAGTHCAGPGRPLSMPSMTVSFQKRWKLSSFRESLRRSRATAGSTCSFLDDWAAVFSSSVSLSGEGEEDQRGVLGAGRSGGGGHTWGCCRR